jgi:hypothetical protein
MLFGYFILLTALVIEAVGAYYSITGLAAIFSGAVLPILIMGASLEVGKVTAAVWLKLYWERASLTYKLYLVPAVAFLMLLTSMGIFGFLSKAHSDQSLVSGDSMAKVAIYDEKIKTAKDNIEANRKALKQMDEAVDQVMARSDDEKGADKAVAIRRSQQKERARLLAEIEVEQRNVAKVSEDRAPFAAEFRKVESEVGPIKYIAALIYGDNPDSNILERAVRWVIILIVAVFDPLALVLILAAQQTLRWAREDQEQKQDEQRFAEDAAQELVRDVDLQEAKEPETSFWERHPYLLKPFAHFKGLMPMVATKEEVKPEPPVVTNTDSADNVPVVKESDPPGETIYVNPPDWGKTDIPDPVLDAYNDERLVSKFDKQTLAEEPKILTAGVDDVERPGDYLTDSEDPEKAAIRAWKMSNPDSTIKGQRQLLDSGRIDRLPWEDAAQALGLEADNEPPVGNMRGFGIRWPDSPVKGDTFLRVDRLPSALYKYNGTSWIEIDKNLSDQYSYDTAYIDHLINKIDSGEYDPDLLTEAEIQQISHRFQTKDS